MSSSNLVFNAITVVNIVINVSYPLLSDSLQSNGGGFFNIPITLALFIDPGIRKLQEIKFNPTNMIIDMQTKNINLLSIFLFGVGSLSKIYPLIFDDS